MTGLLSKIGRQKLQRFYTHSGAALRSVRNFVKVSNRAVSKVKELLHSNTKNRKIFLATPKLKRIKAFSSFQKGIWCINLAYKDELDKDKNGVNYQLVRQDLFDRTVGAKVMITKDSKEIVSEILTMITKKNRPKQI